MAIVPQFDAQGPATPAAPRRQGETARATVGGQLQGLSNLAGSIRGIGQAGQAPLFSADYGQAGLRGLANVGQAMTQLGGIMAELDERRQEAKDYADTVKAQDALTQLNGDFEAFRAESPDPSTWESKWSELYSQFKGSYFDDKENLSPAAREAITLRMDSFGGRVAAQTKVDATKAELDRARKSGMADFMMAADSGDEAAAIGTARYMLEQEWIGPDDAARMEMQAKEAARAKNNERVNFAIDTAILDGDIDTALELADTLIVETPEELINRKTEIKKIAGTRAELSRLEELIYTDPAGSIEEIRKADVPASDRAKLEDMAQSFIHEEHIGTVEGIVKRRQESSIVTPEDLEKDGAYASLPDEYKAAVSKSIRDGVLNDIGEFAKMRNNILGYDPAEDPRGAMRANTELMIALQFEGPQREELQALLNDRFENPAGPSQKAAAGAFKSIDDRFESGEFGNYRITGDQIGMKEIDGVEYFGVKDPDAPEGQSFKRGFTKYRIIELSEADRIKYQTAGSKRTKETFTDLQAKRKADAKRLQVQEQLERKLDKNELTEGDEMREFIGNQFAEEAEKAVDTVIMSQKNDLPTGGGISPVSLFPESATATEELQRLLENADN